MYKNDYLINNVQPVSLKSLASYNKVRFGKSGQDSFHGFFAEIMISNDA